MKFLLNFSVALCAFLSLANTQGQEIPPDSCPLALAEVLLEPSLIQTKQPDEGRWLWNAGVSKCLRGSLNQSEATSLTQMVDCASRAPEPCSTEQGFTEIEGRNGFMLATPWTNSDGTRRGNRCLYTGDEEGGYVWTGKCDPDCPAFAWEKPWIYPNGQHVLMHVATGRCARVEGFRIRLRRACDESDNTYLWELRSELYKE